MKILSLIYLLNMFVLTANIKIGAITLPHGNNVEVISDWKEMTDKATIKIPKKITVVGADLRSRTIYDVINTGDRVIIKLGYDGKNNTEFLGYVARSTSPTMPLDIQCEDEMWRLKRLQVATKTFASGTLMDVLKYIDPISAKDADVIDTELGKNYLVKTGTAAGALKDIETTFGLKSFFRLIPDATLPEGARSILVVGKPYGSADVLTTKPVLYHMQKNVVSNDLTYSKVEDLRIKIKAVSKMPKGKGAGKGKDITVEVGDFDGDIRTMHYFNISKESLTKHANADLAIFKAEGYTGDLTGFGAPFIRHGMITAIADDMYEKRDHATNFHVDATSTTWGEGGFRRKPTIGWKAAGESVKREK